MTTQKNVTLNGLTTPNAVFVLVSVLMILVGAYLTNHYFDVHFPKGIEQASSICNINQFWSCDKATTSPLGAIFNVPTSTIALIMGLYGLICAFAASATLEKNLKIILYLNLLGCLIMGLYSLVVLKGLCLMCTVYYILSATAAFIFYKHSELKAQLDIKSMAGFALIVLIPSGIFGYTITSRKAALHEQSYQFVDQFNNLKSYGDPALESKYRLASATENFADAPIRITIFSDFQCPFCGMVAKQYDEIMQEFAGKINVQYMFYPLDMTCNKDMKGSLHPYACQAAYLAACDPAKFKAVHDHIFENQRDINFDNLKTWEKEFGLSGCFDNKDVQDYVQQTLNAGKMFNLKSTPTIIINGKKIEGSVDLPIMKAILKSLL